jgi:hypothetical protein
MPEMGVMVGGFGSTSMASRKNYTSEAVLKSVSVKLRLWLGIAMNSQAQKPTMFPRPLSRLLGRMVPMGICVRA